MKYSVIRKLPRQLPLGATNISSNQQFVSEIP